VVVWVVSSALRATEVHEGGSGAHRSGATGAAVKAKVAQMK
jgi:hypothetical protein